MVQRSDGTLEGRDAVIDKDFASSLLASRLKADLLVISTGVPQVCINFGRPDQRALSRVTAEELKRYADEGHFAPGSMLPKIQAVIQFLECPDNLNCKYEIKEYLKDYVAADGSVVMVTHDLSEISICDKIYILKDGRLNLITESYEEFTEDKIKQILL